MSTSPASLYERDFVRWTEAQAAELRRAADTGTNLPLDWEHLAEEIESLGSRERREIASRIEQVVLHLLKLQHSPATDPRRGWEETIDRERSEIDEMLTESPSLRQEIGPALARRWPSARRRAVRALAGEVTEGALASALPVHARAAARPRIGGRSDPPREPGRAGRRRARRRGSEPTRPIRASPSGPRSAAPRGGCSPAATSRTRPTRRASAPRPTRSA